MKDDKGLRAAPPVAVWLVDPTGSARAAGLDRLLEQLCAGGRVERLSTVRAAAQSADRSPIVIACSRARSRIFAALAEGSDPVAESRDWAAEARALLQQTRSLRARVTLLDPADFGAAAGPVRDALARRLGLAVPETPPAEAPSGAAPAAPDALARLLAEAILAADGTLRQLAEEIDAMSLAPAGAPGAPAPPEAAAAFYAELVGRPARLRAEHEAVLQELAAARDAVEAQSGAHAERLAAAHAEAEAARQESEAARDLCTSLEARIAEQEQEIERRYLAAEEAERELAAFRAETEAILAGAEPPDDTPPSTAEAARMRQETAARARRIAGLEATCQRFERERDGARERIGSLERELAARTEDIARLEQQLEEVYASTSWRVTRPMRELKLRTMRHREDPEP